MSWRFVYAPNIWPLAFAAVFLLFLSWVGWRNRHVPGALPFALAALCLALWAAAATLEVAAADVATAVFWVRFAALWQLPSTIAMLCFALQFAGLGRWLSRCTLALLCLPVLLADGLMLTNDLHHLVWQGFVYVGHVRPLYGALITPMVAYGYLPATATIVILVWLFSRSPRHRRPVALALCGQAVIRVAYAIDFAGANPLAPLDLTILAALVAATLYAIALFHFRVFDPAAVARAAVIDQMGEGMVVLDDDGCVADLNATAESILDISAAQARGLQAASVLPWWQKQSVSPRGGGGAMLARISLEGGSGARHYLLHISPLQDRYGPLGQLVLLRDVTEEVTAQARLLQEQRAVATMQEREHLARELHDSLGQVLGYVSLQAQAIGKRVHDGDAATAEAQLARLAHVAQTAHLDLRESIFGLKAGAQDGWSFLAALRQHLQSYQAQYGVHVTLALPPHLQEGDLPSSAGVQVLRVIQEALTNARRHGRARSVEVSLARAGSQVRVVVANDGCGFDPAQVAGSEAQHFGLAGMRERMAQAGGCVTIDSRPGAGTRVVLQVPAGDEGRGEDEGAPGG